jgi:succinyl-CoA synthetase beta subunit
MKIHEYQAKGLLAEYGIPVPQGQAAFSLEEALTAASSLGPPPYVVKAQIHAGGRGKGGGVRVVRSTGELQRAAQEILGMTLVTHQTGPEGKKVLKLLIEEGLEIERELYVGIVLDRARACPAVMVSSAGGMDIEEVAEKTPHLIRREWIDPAIGLQPFQTRNLIFSLGLPAALNKAGLDLITRLVKVFQERDCSLVEVNPLVATRDGRLVALDAKINFDDNALFRHPELSAWMDPSEQDPLELEAGRYNLNYIRLNGNIGVMVNGAGLAMATMDLIKLYGGEPANFLDVGGGASTEMIANGFRIILSDRRVQAVLVNIFGGILRCDILAEGLIKAARQVEIKVPLIIRLEGTNVARGRELLQQSGLDFLVAPTMGEAARKVGELVKVENQ